MGLSNYQMTEEFPFDARDIARLVLDVEQYPNIFSVITAAKVLETGADFKRAELTFEMPSVVALSTNVQESHITWTPGCDRIDVNSVKGPFKTMNLSWAFGAAASGKGTAVTFDMVYELGLGWLKDKAAGVFIPVIASQTMKKFSEYAAENLKPAGAKAVRAPKP